MATLTPEIKTGSPKSFAVSVLMSVAVVAGIMLAARGVAFGLDKLSGGKLGAYVRWAFGMAA
jgi:hypothetical protein